MNGFQLCPRWEFPAYAPTPVAYFDRFHKEAGVVYDELSETERREYDTEKTVYVHTCEALVASRAKREDLVRAHQAAHAWMHGQTRAGRSLWGVRVPRSVLRRYSVPRVESRERESGGRRVSRGASGGTGGSPARRSDDDPHPPPDDVDRPARPGLSAWTEVTA